MVMTQSEYDILKHDLKAEIIKELTAIDTRTSAEEKPLLNVWQENKKELHEKYGNVTYHNIWECIRKLAVFRSGHRYIRDLTLSEEIEAAEFAESLIEEMLKED